MQWGNLILVRKEQESGRLSLGENRWHCVSKDKQEFARQRVRGVSQAKGDAGRGLEAEVYGRWREQQDAGVVDFGR